MRLCTWHRGTSPELLSVPLSVPGQVCLSVYLRLKLRWLMQQKLALNLAQICAIMKLEWREQRCFLQFLEDYARTKHFYSFSSTIF